LLPGIASCQTFLAIYAVSKFSDCNCSFQFFDQPTILSALDTLIRLQVSFGNETALIYLWQIVIEPL
jgi:hypothetical protein